MPEHVLTFEEFRQGLARAFNVPVESLREDTNFIEDLAFDSLRMLQLGMVFEALQVEMPVELAWGIQTVGEAYGYYSTAVEAGEAPSEVPGGKLPP